MTFSQWIPQGQDWTPTCSMSNFEGFRGRGHHQLTFRPPCSRPVRRSLVTFRPQTQQPSLQDRSWIERSIKESSVQRENSIIFNPWPSRFERINSSFEQPFPSFAEQVPFMDQHRGQPGQPIMQPMVQPGYLPWSLLSVCQSGTRMQIHAPTSIGDDCFITFFGTRIHCIPGDSGLPEVWNLELGHLRGHLEFQVVVLTCVDQASLEDGISSRWWSIHARKGAGAWPLT